MPAHESAEEGGGDAAAAAAESCASGQPSPGSNGRTAAGPATPIAISIHDGSGGKSAAQRRVAHSGFAGDGALMSATATAQRLRGAGALAAAVGMAGTDGRRAVRGVAGRDSDGSASDEDTAGSDDPAATPARHDALADPSIARARQTLSAEAAALIAISASGQRVRGRLASELTAAAIKRRLIQPRRVVAVLTSATGAAAAVAATAGGADPGTVSNLVVGSSITAATPTGVGASGAARTGPRRHAV